MKIAIVHDEYIPRGSKGVSGEDNIVDLEISLLRDRGHQILDLRGIETGHLRKILQGSIHVFGYGRGLPKGSKGFEIVHAHNLNQRTGYAWMEGVSQPIVQSLHNLRTFCSISIGWRNGSQCFECLEEPASITKHFCGGLYGMSGSLRHLIFQRSRPQLTMTNRLIASSQQMFDLFSNVYPGNRIDVIHNPGLTKELKYLPSSRSGWLFAGRLVPEKGVMELLRHWPDDELLDIAGSGPLERQIFEMTKGKSNIKMLGVFSSSDKTIYSRYQGLFFASTWMEGSPLVVADAIANGLPVIVFGSSAAREQVNLTQAGICVEGIITREKIKGSMNFIRRNSDSLTEKGVKAGQSQLSPLTWIKKIENSLKSALTINYRP